MSESAAVSRPPSNRCCELGPVGAAAFSHRIGKVRANGAEADPEDAGDVAIGTAAGDKSGNLVLAWRQAFASPAPNQRTTQMRFQCIEKIDIAFAEFGTAPPPPDAKIAKIAIAIKDEHVDAVVQSVARQKVIVELGSFKLVAGNHLVDRRRPPAGPERERHWIAELIPILVAAKIARIHVEANRLVEPVFARSQT